MTVDLLNQLLLLLRSLRWHVQLKKERSLMNRSAKQ